MRAGGFCHKNSDYGHEEVETDPSTCACSRSADAMRKTNAKDLAAEESNIVYDKGGQAGLVNDVSPSVHGRSAGHFAPDDKD